MVYGIQPNLKEVRVNRKFHNLRVRSAPQDYDVTGCARRKQVTDDGFQVPPFLFPPLGRLWYFYPSQVLVYILSNLCFRSYEEAGWYHSGATFMVRHVVPRLGTYQIDFG